MYLDVGSEVSIRGYWDKGELTWTYLMGDHILSNILSNIYLSASKDDIASAGAELTKEERQKIMASLPEVVSNVSASTHPTLTHQHLK